MKHPSQATLALLAGGDLGLFARWKAQRHVAICAECRDEVAAFESIREIATDLQELPEVSWQQISAEMTANIRLGLAAGECVRQPETAIRDTRWFTGARAAVAFASMIALVVTGLMLERPSPHRFTVPEGSVAEATTWGIQVSENGEAIGLKHAGVQNTTATVSAHGGVRERYVDPDSGYVTVNIVDAQ
ncbi:MAG TPA: hypothetical protein VN736_17350 [Candidatus Limnocylindrales bacterium]|nr:hypothetical protein [Candidatus Limnocylindrales bacterium]